MKITPEQERAANQRFAAETAIDFELRACAARVIGMAGDCVTPELFMERARLAFVAAVSAIPKMRLSSRIRTRLHQSKVATP